MNETDIPEGEKLTFLKSYALAAAYHRYSAASEGVL